MIEIILISLVLQTAYSAQGTSAAVGDCVAYSEVTKQETKYVAQSCYVKNADGSWRARFGS